MNSTISPPHFCVAWFCLVFVDEDHSFVVKLNRSVAELSLCLCPASLFDLRIFDFFIKLIFKTKLP